MSNKTQLQTNNTNLDALITRVNAAKDVAASLPEAGGGGDDVGALLSNALTEIDSNITSVIDYACRGCSALTTVNLPEVTKIGTYGFHSCSNIASFNAPKVKTLGSYVLYGCKKLTEVNFPLATSVPSNCFYQATALVKADFGAASSIDTYGFIYCSALRTLILRKTDSICTLANTSNCFSSSGVASGKAYIYVPKALIDTYKTATNWSSYAS